MSSDSATMMCGNTQEGASYGIGLHVGAIFIMFGVSVLGFTIPMVLTRSKRAQGSKVAELIVDLGKAFGTGVVCTTAFVHMLADGAENLHSECAPAAFQQYSPFPFVIAVATLFLVATLEFFSVRAFMPADTE